MHVGDLDELVLLRASTKPEEFRWCGTECDNAQWQAIIQAHEQQDGQAMQLAGKRCTAGPMLYALRLAPSLWLKVQCMQDGKPQLTLQGPTTNKERLRSLQVSLSQLERQAVEQELENPVFEVYTGLQSELTVDELEEHQGSAIGQESLQQRTENIQTDVEMLRVIFWSHHLKAPSKKRDMNRWCTELRVFGLVKSGYPGFLCFEGEKDDVQEIVRRIKALQWHAITVKTEVPYTVTASFRLTDEKHGSDMSSVALRQCLLAIGHSASENSGSGDRGAKLRTSMDEVVDSGALVNRLRQANIPEEELLYALNLRA